MSRPLTIFIAAPHNWCDESPDKPRHCDRAASAAISALETAASERNVRIVGRHVSDKLRTTDHDYNRPNTDDTPWREELRRRVAAAAPDFVVEAHSFPGNHEMYRDRWAGSSLVLFDAPNNRAFVHDLAAAIRDALGRVGRGDLKVTVQTPWHPVSITDDMATMKQPHMLFEFNEDMPRDNIPPLADAIISTLETRPWVAVHGGACGVRDGACGGLPAIDQKKMESLMAAAIIVVIALLVIVFLYWLIVTPDAPLKPSVAPRTSWMPQPSQLPV